MLKLNDIHTYYGESCALWGVSLEVPEGQVVALLGRNGMGKSTTVHSVIGFTPPREGQITFRGRAIAGLPPHAIAQQGIALVPQGRRIFPSLTVEENLTMAARRGRRPHSWSLAQVYELFPILQKRAHVRGTLLSGGEQQMLAFGRAMMTAPDLILMDEPSEGLAPMVVRELGRIIGRLRDAGLSILLVEQNVQLALSVADYVYVLSKGAIVYEATPKELRANEEVKTHHLGAST